MKYKGRLLVALLGLAAALPSQAEIYTLADFTRPAGEATNNAVHFNFDPNGGWSGTPPNAISGESSLYLKFTVSWVPTADIGTFFGRFNANDNGGAARVAGGTEGSGFALITGNNASDPDGTGPATAKPTVDAVDKTAVTSATFVLKIDQIQAATSPGGDWWFGDITQQDGAFAFLYINPDLGANEAIQSTKWAAWRSGNASYQGVTFQTNTADVDLNFTDIALYTGEDTPFSTAVGGVDAATSTVSASPAAVPADGVSTSTITVTLKDSGGIPVADKLVSLANTAGPGTPLIDPATAASDFNGVATFSVSSTTVGTEEFTATGDSVPITQTASVDFASALTDAGNSTVVASPITIPADGATESVINVTLKNSTGLPLPGKLVTLANTAGPGTPDINPAASGSDTTDANGVATFAATSTTVGLEEFTATCDPDSVTLAADAVSVEFVTPDPAALLVYDGFDYDLGVLSGQDGGTGFSAGWASPQAGFTATVFDETGGTYVTWDNVVGNVTMSSPPRYLASTETSNPGSTATRALASDAGTLAGADNVLWMGVVFHYADTTGSGGLNIGLTSGGSIVDRGRSIDTAGADFIGVTNYAQSLGGWNTRLNATILEDAVTGTGYAGPYVQDLGTQAFSTTEDMLVVLKFTFGNSDRVEAAFFTESETLSEAAFYTNPTRVSATYAAGIDESLINTISYTQGRGGNAIDEIRIGSTFADTFGGDAPASDYDNWAGNYPGLGLPGDDDDSDGLTNDNERIFGLNPTDPSSVDPYVAPFDAATGGFSYTRRTQSLTGLTYKIWYSTDLEQWFEDAVGSASQTPGSPTNEVEIVGVTVDPALLSLSKLFIQVSAEVLGPPTPAPELIGLWGSGTSITLNFTEAMNETAATEPLNYQVSNLDMLWPITSAVLSSDGKTVTLTLGSALGIDTAYNLTMTNLVGSGGTPLGGSGTAQFQTWDNDPDGIKVFIFAGQSNMVGYGKTEWGGNPAWTEGGTEPKEILGGIGCLRYLANNNASYPEYDYTSLLVDPGQPATSTWKTRRDVKVWWRNGSSGNLGGPISKGDLGPPFQGAQGIWFGPEFAFGQVIGDHYTSNDVLIIKTAWGGRSLGVDFRPPSAVAARGGAVGPFYEAIFDNVREVLGNLGSEFPDWSGKGYQIVGFGWHQGFNDKVDGTLSAEYDENLPDFISDVRAEFGQPDLPFVIATTGMANAGPVDPSYSGYSAVEKAQLWVAGIAQPAKVLSDDTRPYWRDKSVAPSTQGHHWNHSAESYFLIGKAMAIHMMSSLKSFPPPVRKVMIP